MTDGSAPEGVPRPTVSVQEVSRKISQKFDRKQTKSVFLRLVLALLAAHAVIVLAITRDGFIGYVEHWGDIAVTLVGNPPLAFLFPASLLALYKGVDLWRHPDPEAVPLPDMPAVDDLRWSNDIYVASGWTREGKQSGATLMPEDELLDEGPHIVLKEKGLFGNIHCKGGVGSGKTSTLIMPFVDQAVSKFPKPPRPEWFPLGKDGRYLPEPGLRPGPVRRVTRGALDVADTRSNCSPPRHATWNPYVGMTEGEAAEEYERLLHQHRERKWGLFLIDPKGDLTEFVQRAAAAADRAEDVVVLRPDGEYTYNPLDINPNPLVQAETVMDGIEAVSGQAIQQYWRGTMSEWLANALTILRVAEPTGITFKSILRMARNEGLRTHMVSEAEAVMRQAKEDEDRLGRLGRDYDGVRVNPAAVEFFRDWDDEEADPGLKRAVVSGIKMQSKFFVDDELAPFLCPEMPPTFDGFEDMIDKGKIVVLRMPLDTYGPVAKVMGILVLADAQQAARTRINKPEMNQERVVAFVVDEISAYLNKLTKDFIAMNRQSRVCFMAAHQSQGQLVQHGDRGFETSFNDNLRTKISFSTPNAEAARNESAIYGARRSIKKTVSENQNFSRIERVDADPEAFAPTGHEAKGASIRYDEVERPWFTSEDFMGLETGECVISEFNGNKTLPPRRAVAPAYWRSRRSVIANHLTIDTQRRTPHPLVVIGEDGLGMTWLATALELSRFVIVWPLADAGGDLAGWRFVAEAGTVVVSCRQMEEGGEIARERFGEPGKLIVHADPRVSGLFLHQHLGWEADRALELREAYRQAVETETPPDVREIYETEVGYPMTSPARGGWEFVLDKANRAEAVQESREIVALYKAIGARLSELGDEAIEELVLSGTDTVAQYSRANPPVVDDESTGSAANRDASQPQAPRDDLWAAEGDPFGSDEYPWAEAAQEPTLEEIPASGPGRVGLEESEPAPSPTPAATDIDSPAETANSRDSAPPSRGRRREPGAAGRTSRRAPGPDGLYCDVGSPEDWPEVATDGNSSPGSAGGRGDDVPRAPLG